MYLYMIICIIGSRGRKHAICEKISQSSKVNKIYCIPGNAGTQQLAENIDLDYQVSVEMKVNDRISTNLILQLVYDDNAVQNLQVRQVFGIGLRMKLK